MRCSRCGNLDSKVLESRMSGDARCLRRRRHCPGCGHRFTTYEKEENFLIHIKKRNGSIEPYSKDKLIRSVQIACQKRPVKIEEIEFLVAQIEGKLQETGEHLVGSRRLGDLIMEGLCSMDSVAYVRFASVYKDFKDPNEFYGLLKTLD